MCLNVKLIKYVRDREKKYLKYYKWRIDLISLERKDFLKLKNIYSRGTD